MFLELPVSLIVVVHRDHERESANGMLSTTNQPNRKLHPFTGPCVIAVSCCNTSPTPDSHLSNHLTATPHSTSSPPP